METQKPASNAGSGAMHCSTVCADCESYSYRMLEQDGDDWVCHHCLSKRRYPRWPRGKYNGRRIVGISFKVVLDVTAWHWLPMIGHGHGMFHWLCFLSWTEAKYE